MMRWGRVGNTDDFRARLILGTLSLVAAIQLQMQKQLQEQIQKLIQIQTDDFGARLMLGTLSLVAASSASSSLISSEYSLISFHYEMF